MKKMRFVFVKKLFGPMKLVVLFLILLAGQQPVEATLLQESPEMDQLVYLPLMVTDIEPIVPETTEVLTDETADLLADVSPDGSQFTFDGTNAQLNSLEAGDIIMSDPTEAAANGFLRRVVDVATVDGNTVVETIPATLEEAIEQGRAIGHKKLTPDDIQNAMLRPGVQMMHTTGSNIDNSFSFSVNDIVLYDDDGNTNTTYDQLRATGSIEFSVGFDVDLVVRNHKVKKVDFSTTVEEKVTIELFAEADLASFEGEIPLADLHLGTYTVWVGPAPIVFTLELPIALKADGSIVVGITTGVTQSAEFTGGIIYKHGEWDTYQSFSKSFTYNPPTPYIGVELRGYIEPKLQLKLYGIAGPYATIEPYIKFEAASNQTPWWTLSAGIEAKVGMEIEVLGHSIGTAEFVLGYDVILAEASEPPLPAVHNGDFESGRYNGWSETSTNGFPLVVDDDLALGFPPGFTPRSGEWQVWLGGWADERGTIRQNFTLPNTTPIYLHHYYKVKAHGQVCGFADYAQVLVNGEVVMEKDLCVSEHTSNWTLEAIDISDYAGQQVSIMFLAQTDGNSDTSSYFIDDVSLSQHPSGFLLNLEAEAPIVPGTDEVLTAVP